MRHRLLSVAIALALAGCGEKDTPYVAAVRDQPPIYCYQTLAGVDCYAQPNFRNERQLVNFYGPPPRDYARPEPAEPARLEPPPEVDFYCRVAEPDACPLTTASAPAQAIAAETADASIAAEAADPPSFLDEPSAEEDFDEGADEEPAASAPSAFDAVP